jgi:hypothetical protein
MLRASRIPASGATGTQRSGQKRSWITGGKRPPGLGAPDGGRRVAAQTMKVAGLSWNLLDPA